MDPGRDRRRAAVGRIQVTAPPFAIDPVWYDPQQWDVYWKVHGERPEIDGGNDASGDCRDNGRALGAGASPPGLPVHDHDEEGGGQARPLDAQPGRPAVNASGLDGSSREQGVGALRIVSCKP